MTASATQRLIVRHLGGEGEPRFVVMQAADHRDAELVSVASPEGFEVAGSSGELLTELAWYLEKFLDYPFPPRTEQAERARQALRQWGRQAFEALFNSGRARDFYSKAVSGGLEGLCIEVRSDDPRILAWPWEALEDAESSILALGCQIERRLSKLAEPAPLSENLPKDELHAKVMATLRFVEESLPAEIRPLLAPLALHERFAEVDDLKAMAEGVPGKWSPLLIDRLMVTLTVSGLVTHRGNGIHELHPALTGFLRASSTPEPLRDAWERAFVDRMGTIADYFAPKELHEQRGVFGIHEELPQRPLARPATHHGYGLRRPHTISCCVCPEHALFHGSRAPLRGVGCSSYEARG